MKLPTRWKGGAVHEYGHQAEAVEGTSHAPVIRPMVRDDEETRIVIRGVGWAAYDAISNAVPEGSPVRVIVTARTSKSWE